MNQEDPLCSLALKLRRGSSHRKFKRRPKTFNHRLNLLGKKSVRIGKYLRKKKKKHPKRENRSNYPKAMLIVTTFQAETTFKDRSADRLRQLFCFGYHGRLLVGRADHFRPPLFFLFQLKS